MHQAMLKQPCSYMSITLNFMLFGKNKLFLGIIYANIGHYIII